MAERIVVQLVDDINGAEITDDSGERINFSVRGVDYQIDLSAANVAKFEKALAPYLDAATRVGGRRTRTAKAAEPSGRSARGGASRGRGKKAAGKPKAQDLSRHAPSSEGRQRKGQTSGGKHAH